MEVTKEQVISDPPFSIVVPVRNRWGARLRNCIRSLELQSLQPLEIIVADYGSTEEGHRKILRTLEDANCSIYYYPTEKTWNLARARNMGIRHSDPNCMNVAVIDADLVLETRVIEILATAHASRIRSYISCFIRMLRSTFQPRELRMPEDFPKLKKIKFWASAGWGGLVSASRSWLFSVRGFDERMKFWGAEDIDLWKRAGLAGMDRYRLNDLEREEAEIYHQWHDNCLSWDQSRLTKAEADQITWNKMIATRDNTIVRNNEDWGLWRTQRIEEDRFIYD